MAKFTPFPGAPLWETIREEGTFEEDWRQMNCLNFVFVPKGDRLPGAARPALQRACEAVLHRPRLAQEIPGPPLGAPPQPLAHGEAPARFHRRPPPVRTGQGLGLERR